MNKRSGIALGILTAIGGFVDVTRGRRTLRIPWEDVAAVGPDVCLRAEAEATGATHAADWVREHIVRFIPGLK